MPAEAELEDAARCVDHVLPRRFTRPALAVSAWDLGTRDDDSSVLAFLAHDRDLQRFAHDQNGTAVASDGQRRSRSTSVDPPSGVPSLSDDCQNSALAQE
jgi:hypothetical protein